MDGGTRPIKCHVLLSVLTAARWSSAFKELISSLLPVDPFISLDKAGSLALGDI
jgi:hypothetical protein